MSGKLAVIFDVDGVLVDSYQAHLRSWQELADQHGTTMTESDFAATFGRTSREIIAELWSERSDRRITQLDDQKEAIYRRIIAEALPVMPGAGDLIDALDSDGFRLAVGSSGPPENVQLVLEQLGELNRFQASVTGNDVTRGKPDPQVFQLAAARLGVAPGRCAVVEDAAAGIAAAGAAGMASIGLVSTGRRRDELTNADLVVDRLNQLSPSIIRQLIETDRS